MQDDPLTLSQSLTVQWPVVQRETPVIWSAKRSVFLMRWFVGVSEDGVKLVIMWRTEIDWQVLLFHYMLSVSSWCFEHFLLMSIEKWFKYSRNLEALFINLLMHASWMRKALCWSLYCTNVWYKHFLSIFC